MYAKHPEIARRWTREHGSKPVKTAIKKMRRK